MPSTYFITGISTDVGKTVVAAVITEALNADYWKPIQAGDLDHSDTHKVQKWVSNKHSKFHKSAYALQTPMSPHAAADIENITIETSKIARPQTNNNLVIEGAGGLLVPLNNQNTICDLINPTDRVIVVSKHYLGSINHTLLTLEILKARQLTIAGIIFVGHAHPTTEQAIATLGKTPILGRINWEPYIDAHVISEYAAILQPELLK